jgi:hypothetical protein
MPSRTQRIHLIHLRVYVSWTTTAYLFAPMADTLPAPAALVVAAPEPDHGATGDSNVPKASASKTKKSTTTATKPRKSSTSHVLEHPKYQEMIANAISHLKERGGSSRQAILKYIMNKYNVGKEVNMVNARVKVALKAGVKIGNLKQSKGTGASGSFRLADKRKAAASSDKKPGRPKTIKAKKPSGAKAGKAAKSPTKKAGAKKAGSGKAKAAKSPKKVVAKSTKKAAGKPKAKSTAKKSSQTAAKKAKTPSKKSPAKGAAAKSKKQPAGKKAK